jgi:phosphoribosylaminoimidazole carboxylase PurE protein
LSKPLVGIVMGSDSDFPIMQETSEVLKEFDVEHEIIVTSAHRSPARTRNYVKKAEKEGIKILIAGAGAAAHLAGALAAESILPIIGVPIDSSPHKGLDALLSTSQMPGGVPVATMGIGKSGARNAGLLAVQILALEDNKLHSKLVQYKKYQAKEVEIKSRKIQSVHARNNKD